MRFHCLVERDQHNQVGQHLAPIEQHKKQHIKKDHEIDRRGSDGADDLRRRVQGGGSDLLRVLGEILGQWDVAAQSTIQRVVEFRYAINEIVFLQLGANLVAD